MNDFKLQIRNARFKSTEESSDFEDKVRRFYGLQYRYEAARLLIGRSLAEHSQPDPLPPGAKSGNNKPIQGDYLFGEHDDLWMCALILDGKLGANPTVEEFRALVEAHWARGYQLVRDELEHCQSDAVKLVQRLGKDGSEF